jgi:hypothetical protein
VKKLLNINADNYQQTNGNTATKGYLGALINKRVAPLAIPFLIFFAEYQHQIATM